MLIVCLAGIAYCAIALAAIARFAARPQPRRAGAPVTIFKPIHGLEVELFENLCSFCEQDYPHFQIIFGVQRADDPAIATIERAIARYPDRDLSLVVDTQARPGNPKMSNVAGMLARAKYDLFVISDADMRVGPEYLSCVVAEFDDARAGAATCLYAGEARGGLASQLAAMQLNDQFAPSVLVAGLGGEQRFCFGSTMAVRRAVLDEIGGIAALATQLADDYALGQRVAARGYRVALSRYVVRNVVYEPTLRAMFDHELRWARTIRMVQPLGYAFSFITFPLPLALLWTLFSPGSAAAWAVLFVTFALRVAIDAAMRRVLKTERAVPAWLLPLRDGVGLAVWACGLIGRTVRWQERTIVAGERGAL